VSEVTVIDYGVGNLLSVRRGFEHCGATVTLASNAEQILAAPRVVLPGVGAFRNAMQALNELDLVPIVREVATRGTPLLGICLGMQLLLDESEEFGIAAGIGLIAGRVRGIPSRSTTGDALKVPHIGWSGLQPAEGGGWDGTLLADNHPGNEVYFVHSFMADPVDRRHRLADSVYGGNRIAAVITKDNVSGCQFHPEKSGEFGLKILGRFLRQ
jgi:glutamine amidotransferase